MVTALTACRFRRLSRHANSQRRSEHGGAAIEFALTLPIVLAVMFGIIEFGLYLFYLEVLTNAAREGARAAIVMTPKRDGKSVEQNARTAMENYLTAAGWNPKDFNYNVSGYPCTDTGPPPAQSGQNVCVTIKRKYDYKFIVLGILNGLPFINANLPASIPLKAPPTTMVLE